MYLKLAVVRAISSIDLLFTLQGPNSLWYGYLRLIVPHIWTFGVESEKLYEYSLQSSHCANIFVSLGAKLRTRDDGASTVSPVDRSRVQTSLRLET